MKKGNPNKKDDVKVYTGKKFSKGRKGKKPADTTADTTFSNSRECIASKRNDPSWYVLNPQLVKDTASYPYAWPLGNKLDLGPNSGNFKGASLPGMMVMNWAPTIGNSESSSDPVNVASINVYTKVRHDNSGHANYDHADYMMYLLAMDSVYAFHSWMRRVYGVMYTYSVTNRFYPVAVAKAMGVDFYDIQSHLADFRAYVNEYAIKASALAIPKNMTIMTKHYWMSEGLYLDSDQDKPQTYIFNPLGFYQFALAEGATPHGTLQFLPLFGTAADGSAQDSVAAKKLLKFEDIRAYGESLLHPIIADEDFGIMSGDTLKSFGIGGCYTLPSTSEDYTVLPAYLDSVLDQIQNATFIGDPVVASMTIDQDVDIGSGSILVKPKFVHPWYGADGDERPGQNAFLVDRFITFEHGDVTPEQTLEATRWTNISEEVEVAGTKDYYVLTMGTEVMCHGRIVSFNAASKDADQIQFSDPIYVSMCTFNIAQHVGPTTQTTLNSSVKKMTEYMASAVQRFNVLYQQLSVFNRHPAVYATSYVNLRFTDWCIAKEGEPAVKMSTDQSTYGTINGVMMDINYYTILNKKDLTQMSNIALLSEFDVTSR